MVLFTLLLAGCPAKKPSNDAKASSGVDGGSHQNGGYDWGGGELIKSSPTLVKRMIEISQSNAGERSVEKSIFRQFLIWNTTTAAAKQKVDSKILFPNSGDGLMEDLVKLTDSPALDAIAVKKLKLLDEGDCPKPKKERTADASVTKHSLDAEVCFSVGNLSRVSPSDLTKQVMGLTLHEAVHMAGGGEEVAVSFQEAFNVFFATKFGETLSEAYLANVGPQLYEVILDFDKNRDSIRIKQPLPIIYGIYGRAYGSLTKIQGIEDIFGLKLRLGIKDDIVVESFVKSLWALKELMVLKFGLGPSSGNLSVLTQSDLEATDLELRRLAKQMWRLWSKVEKASLCDERGDFFYQPKNWFLEDVCKKTSS